MPCNRRTVRPDRRNFPATLVRRWTLLVALISTVFTANLFATEFGDGPILGNPAEKFFDETATPLAKKNGARFADNEINPITAIRQASDVSPGVWDNPVPATEATLPDWGTGPALVAPTLNNPSASNIASPNVSAMDATGNPATQQGVGWGQMPMGNQMIDPNAYYSQNPYANSYWGTGYYDPNFVGSYADFYAGGGYNPYGNYAGYYDPTQMMIQQSPYSPFPQALNGPFPNAEMAGNPMTAKKADTNDAEESKPDSEWTMRRLMPLKVSSPLGETLLSGLKTISPFNTPSGADKGCGQPLMMRSWQDHPFYFGGFVGSISGSQLVDKMIDQKTGANGGLKLGYNFNDYWGVESRFHFASIDIRETAYGKEIYDDWYTATYTGLPYRPLTTRSNHMTMFDVSVQYYPLGNAKWRPFFTYGLGLTRESFIDTFGVKNRVDAVTMPIGIGLRYWWNERLAIQADLVDNVIFSTGQAKTQNNFAFVVGVSYAFGTNKKSRPTAYWPYTPSMGSRW